MNLKKYWIVGLLMTVIAMPMVVSFIWWMPVTYTKLSVGGTGFWYLVFLPWLVLPVYFTYWLGKTIKLPERYWARYGVFWVPAVVWSVTWLALSFVSDGAFDQNDYRPFIFLPYYAPLMLAIFHGQYWVMPVSLVVCTVVFMAAFAFGTWRSGRFKTTENSRALPVVALVLALFGASMGQWYVQYNSVAHDDSDHPEMDDDSRLYEYEPLKEGYGKLPKLAATPSLEIDHDYPRLSGDQALLPVYAAAVNSIYYLDAGYYNRDPRLAALCMHCTTPEAFQSLLDGKSDMIFAAAPTADQKQLAAEAGLSYTLTPIGREALVFMVNDKNAVTGLSTEQLRDVYSGKVTDWQQVGGGAGKILAYQRKPDSASQNVMASAVMRGAPLREPLKIDHFIGRRQGMERRLALYQNLPGALGYTFRFHATKLFASAGTRLLAVDGVEPTADNIRNGSYRLAWDFYIITVRPLSGNAARLRDWFVSDEGQRVIWQVGYVPVKAAGLTPARPWH